MLLVCILDSDLVLSNFRCFPLLLDVVVEVLTL